MRSHSVAKIAALAAVAGVAYIGYLQYVDHVAVGPGRNRNRPDAGAVLVAPRADTPTARAAACVVNVGANPFASGGARCGAEADAAPPQAAPVNAVAIGGALRGLARCPDGRKSADCAPSVERKARLVAQLEELNRHGDAQAQFELGMQIQRTEQVPGRPALAAADVAGDATLQRAVALLAQAAAAGNADALRFRDASAQHARLLHTGR
ncbi:MAG TPA: hypothetical protein DCW29_17665 [Janthinobacterium sp.]|nr:hypothetical protein [Janthinobacterium sp.]